MMANHTHQGFGKYIIGRVYRLEGETPILSLLALPSERRKFISPCVFLYWMSRANALTDSLLHGT